MAQTINLESFKYKTGQYGYKNKKTGEIVIAPIYNNAAPEFDGGLAAVLLNDKWGFIDQTGKEITPLKYDGSGPFREGLANVVLAGKEFYIDKTGKIVFPLI